MTFKVKGYYTFQFLFKYILATTCYIRHAVHSTTVCIVRSAALAQSLFELIVILCRTRLDWRSVDVKQRDSDYQHLLLAVITHASVLARNSR